MPVGCCPRAARRATGVTLVEAAVVLSIVGVLTALVVPAYLHFGKRQLLQQAIAVADRCREAVEQRVQAMSEGDTGRANGYGCEVVWDPGPSKYVRQMTTNANGVITLVPGNTGDAALDGQPLQFRPWVHLPGTPGTDPVPLNVAQRGGHQGLRIGGWHCSPAIENPQLLRVLPSSCRRSMARTFK